MALVCISRLRLFRERRHNGWTPEIGFGFELSQVK
jgi:hypothetical protein